MSIKINRLYVIITVTICTLIIQINASEKKYKLIFLGDSLTAGYQLSSSQAYPALIQAKIANKNWTVVNAGVSGDTTAGGLSRISWILKGNPDIVVVALGANDGLRGIHPLYIQRNLDKIVYRIQESGATAILVGMQLPVNYGQNYRYQFTHVYKQIAQKYVIAFIPFLLEDVATHPEYNLSDGLHPNARGHLIIADRLWPSIQDALKKRERGEK
jgi:acyl-CoA thioesterase I